MVKLWVLEARLLFIVVVWQRSVRMSHLNLLQMTTVQTEAAGVVLTFDNKTAVSPEETAAKKPGVCTLS